MRSFGNAKRTQADKLQSALLFIAWAKDETVAGIDAARLSDREGLTDRGMRQQVAYALHQRQARLSA